MLMQKRRDIAQIRRDYNLFILDLAMPNKVMQATLPKQAMTAKSRGKPTHLVNRNKQVWVWHQKMVYANNAKIIRASKLLIKMGDFNAKYNSEEVYSNSK